MSTELASQPELAKRTPQAFTGPREWHTTDLGEGCMRRVQLRLMGRIEGETGGALWLGNAVHYAMELLWSFDDWSGLDEAHIEDICRRSSVNADNKAKKENRPLTYSMQASKNQDARQDQEKLLRRIVTGYFGTIAPDRPGMRVLGCEVPMRCVLKIDGEPVQFATHADLVWRDEQGKLHIDDFKTQEECPTRAYLARWVQGACMWLWAKHGSFFFPTDIGSMPMAFGEYPEVRWVQMRNFLPYTRKTTVTEDGVRCTYAAGEARPLSRCILHPAFEPAFEGRIIEHITDRIRMARAGLWPRTPDEQGCNYCDSRMHCTGFGGFSNDNI